MKYLKIYLITILLLPTLSFAENFSKVFVGIAGNTPIKLQITDINNQIQGFYEYSKLFNSSYISGFNYINGSDTNNIIKLTSVNDSKNKVTFIGKLNQNKAKGIPTYQINGKWQDDTHSINSPVSFVEQTFLINNNAWLINQFSTVANNKNFYSIQVSYPQIKGMNLSITGKNINKNIETFLQTHTKAFVHQVINNNKTEHFPNMNSNSNTLSISNTITATTPKILSIRFQLSSYYSHAAHPSTTYVSLNFDPSTGNLISLASLFKPNSDYLNVLANISRLQLIKKLYPNLKNPDPKNYAIKWIYQGTIPDTKNYRVWNIYNNQLVLTFQEYQVAPYVFGQQTIMIPLDKLTTITKFGGLIDVKS